MTDAMNFVPTQLQHLPDTVTVADVARVMQTTTRTVRRLVKRGELPAPLRFGRLVRWPRQAIAEILAGRATNDKTPPVRCRRGRRRT